MASNTSSTYEYKPVPFAISNNADNVAEDRQARTPSDNPWMSLWRFVSRNPSLIVALLFGTAGAYACFAFTYWLSEQIFECPSWAIFCTVSSSVHFFAERLGFVQGFLSSLYGICIACIAYVSYELAETTLWPLLAQHSFTLKEIDQFLAHSRGSLSSFPAAAWRFRGSVRTYPLDLFNSHTDHASQSQTHFATVLVVALISALLQVNSTIVGWAFTIVPVATSLQSNHTTGGGMGFSFTQTNPQAPISRELQVASALYSSWSWGQSTEVLPDLRGWLIDRSNLSSIGNFSVDALQVRMGIDCYGEPIEINETASSIPAYYYVPTHLEDVIWDYSIVPYSKRK